MVPVDSIVPCKPSLNTTLAILNVSNGMEDFSTFSLHILSELKIVILSLKKTSSVKHIL